MATETHSTSSGQAKACQNCKNQFTIEPEDFNFYEKIKVPAPTWCPECRIRRRMIFLNQRTLYKRSCDLCKKTFISLFPATSSHPVYCPTCWWGDAWDPLEYGQEYDFSKPFFVQMKELVARMPNFGPQTMYTTLVNSEYSNIASYLKNCYLVHNSDYSEDSAYAIFLERSKNCFDIYMADEAELCYEGINLRKCHKVFFSIDCQDCLEIYFSKNLRGCSYCFGCVNLRNKNYHIFNKPYAKEDYLAEIKKFNLGSYKTILELRHELEKRQLLFPKKYMEGVQNARTTGGYIFNSKNTFESYEVLGVEDSKFCQFLFISPTKDSYDITMWGGGVSRSYDCMGIGDGTDNVKFSFDVWTNAMNLEYCLHILAPGSNLFGCMNLRNKQYCILNKQYSKEDYEKLVPMIKEHMNKMPYIDSKGRVYKYGEFFPPELSPFAYNEAIVQEYFPLTKESALEQGLTWMEPEDRNYLISKKPGELKDHIDDFNEEILNDIVGCAHGGKCNEQCSTAFKIIPQEFQFYKRMNIPLPRLCPNCRHFQRLKQRNPIKLWHRKCTCAGTKSDPSTSSGYKYQNTVSHFHGADHCPNEFETSYAPERPEIVYCENCYNSEVV